MSVDEGNGDAWSALPKQITDSQILVIAKPIWTGQPGSVSKHILERLDAMLSDIDKQGRYPTFGKIARVGLVGNEDGAHHVTAEIYQALADVGFTIPSARSAYLVGEATGSVDYKDLKRRPKKVTQTIETLASNVAHLAKLRYPAP